MAARATNPNFVTGVPDHARGVESFLRKQAAQSRGYYREFSPSADLHDIVACNWVSVVSHEKFGAATPIIPDGCSDIMIYDADAPHVVGPDTTVRWAGLPDGLIITGLRLRPGAWRAVFSCSATALLDNQALLSDLGAVSMQFRDALNFADNLQRRHALLEAWVRSAVTGLSANDRVVLSACRLLSTDAQLEIGELSRRLGWHPRMLHRQFIAACGYGPKHLQRIMRVQTALRIAHGSTPAAPLSDIANSAGFADQAHMTREFRELTQFTPAAYFARYTPEIGTWLTADWSPESR